MKGQPTTPSLVKAENQTEPTPEMLEQIRARAHELFEQRGREEGHDLDTGGVGEDVDRGALLIVESGVIGD